MPTTDIEVWGEQAPAVRAIIASHVRLQCTERMSRHLFRKLFTFTVTGDEPHLSRFIAEYNEWFQREQDDDAW